MKKLTRIATPLIAVAIMTSVPFMALAQSSPMRGAKPKTTQPRTGTLRLPGTEQAQQGYRDGIEAAKLDALAKRKIDAKSSHLYVHPPVKGDAVNCIPLGLRGRLQRRSEARFLSCLPAFTGCCCCKFKASRRAPDRGPFCCA